MLGFLFERDVIRRAGELLTAGDALFELEMDFQKTLEAFQKETVSGWAGWSGDTRLFPAAWRNGRDLAACFELRCWGSSGRRWLMGAARANGLHLAYVLVPGLLLTRPMLFAFRLKRLLDSRERELKGAALELWPGCRQPVAPLLTIPVRGVSREELAGASRHWLSVMREPLSEALGIVRGTARAVDGLIREMCV